MVTTDRKEYLQALQKSIKNTSLESAVMTAASLYFNKKSADIWYFSAPTNTGSTVEVIGDGLSNVATTDTTGANKKATLLDKVNSSLKDMQTAVTSAVDKISLGNATKLSKTVPKSKSSVLPEAYFIDMAVNYGGTAVSAPIEEGSFTTYNKTSEPFKINAVLAFDENKGKQILNKRNVTSLQDTLTKLVTLKKSPITFDIITPSRVYKNVTLEKFDFKMSRETGYGVLFVNAVFVEIPEVKVNELRPIDVKKVDGLKPSGQGTKKGEYKNINDIPWGEVSYENWGGVDKVKVGGQYIDIELAD